MTARPPAPGLPPERKAAMRATLMDHARETARAPRRRRWRLPILIPVFAVAIAGGAAAAAGLFSGDLDDPTGVTCYRAADLGAPREYVETGVWEADASRSERTATEMCAPYWKRGAFGDGERVPPLIACVRDGRVAVFPGPRGTCAELGLQAIAAESFRTQARRRLAFEEAVQALELGRCSDPGRLRERVLVLLERNGMTGWKVRLDGRPKCVAFLDADYETRQVLITGDPGYEPSGHDGFTISGTITDAEEITREEYEQRAREGIRRACSEQATSMISNILSCLTAKGEGREACSSVRVARNAVRPFLEKELGPGATVVVEGEGDCLTGFELRDPEGQVVLYAARTR